MNTSITDTIVHTRELLSEAQFNQLSTQIYQQQGIVSFSRSPHTPRFLMVVYDTARIQALQILNTITAMGHRASLLGL